MERIVKGSHLMVAIDNANFQVTLNDKIQYLSLAIQPGYSYEELLEVITNDEEIPKQYIESLESIGIKLNSYDQLSTTEETVKK